MKECLNSAKQHQTRKTCCWAFSCAREKEKETLQIAGTVRALFGLIVGWMTYHGGKGELQPQPRWKSFSRKPHSGSPRVLEGKPVLFHDYDSLREGSSSKRYLWRPPTLCPETGARTTGLAWFPHMPRAPATARRPLTPSGPPSRRSEPAGDGGRPPGEAWPCGGFGMTNKRNGQRERISGRCLPGEEHSKSPKHAQLVCTARYHQVNPMEATDGTFMELFKHLYSRQD